MLQVLKVVGENPSEYHWTLSEGEYDRYGSDTLQLARVSHPVYEIDCCARCDRHFEGALEYISDEEIVVCLLVDRLVDLLHPFDSGHACFQKLEHDQEKYDCK